MTGSVQGFDVVVVGGGIVGASAAAGLASACPALQIALVDAAPKALVGVPADIDGRAQFDPRVVALTKESQQFLSAINAWELVNHDRVCAYTDMRVWDAEGTGSVHFDAYALGQTSLGCIVENSNLVQALNQRLEHLPSVKVLQGMAVQRLSSPGASGKREILFENGQVLSAPLVIAADGAHSKLRDLLAVPTREWDYGHNAIVTTVTHEHHHQFTAWQRFLASGPLAFLPLTASIDSHDQGRQSSIVWSVETALAESLLALPEDRFNARLTQAFEGRLGVVTQSDTRAMFPLRQRHVTEYFCDGVVFVGDAAHTIHPLAGQGANLGLGDVEVLIEEVSRAVRRNLPLHESATLRRYQRRRKTNNLAMMTAMEGFKRLFGADNLTVRCLRNMGMAAVDNMPLVKNYLARQAMGV